MDGRTGADRALDFARVLTERGLQIEYSIQCRCDSIERELFKTLKASGLAGCTWGGMGSQPQLDRYRKGVSVEQVFRALEILTDLGIFVQMGFIMFDPYATVDDISANQQFLAKVKAMVPEGQLGTCRPPQSLYRYQEASTWKSLRTMGGLRVTISVIPTTLLTKKHRCFITYPPPRPVYCGGPKGS